MSCAGGSTCCCSREHNDRVAIEPDTKDWTWVITQRCPECGFDAATVAPDDFPALVRENADNWVRRLAGDDVGNRPTDDVWSPLEYACHVRDVHRIFAGRVRQMLEEDDPRFANWDQDVAAVEGRYDEQAPTVVAVELAQAADAVAGIYASVSGDQWERAGRRSDGSVFTVASIGRYHLHDVVHHVHDIR